MALPVSCPSVHVWIALARAYRHGWVDRLRTDIGFRSLQALATAHGDEIGATARSKEFPGRELGPGFVHCSRTDRVRWEVAPENGDVIFSIFRPNAHDAREPNREVIWVEVSREEGVRLPRPDIDLVHLAEYEARHVVELRRLLLALTIIPPAFGGISDKAARTAANIVAVGQNRHTNTLHRLPTPRPTKGLSLAAPAASRSR